MNNKDRLAWQQKTRRLNEGRELALGMKVKDLNGHRGVVVDIQIPYELTVEYHGRVAVWQSERFNYGTDNCEHYCYFNWKDILRIED